MCSWVRRGGMDMGFWMAFPCRWERTVQWYSFSLEFDEYRLLRGQSRNEITCSIYD